MVRELPILNMQQPKEYFELRDAATRFFQACGSKTLCTACSTGKLYNGRSNGCCQGCQNLGPTGCLNKPVGCAIWTCGDLNRLIPSRFVRRIQHLQEKYRTYGPAFRARDFSHVRDVKSLKALTATYNRMTKWVKLTGWHPNWPLMEKLTEAVPGVLSEQ